LITYIVGNKSQDGSIRISRGEEGNEHWNGIVPEKLYKYQIYRPCFFKDILLKINHPSEFNDPFEALPASKSVRYFLANGPFRTQEEREKTLLQFERQLEEYGPIVSNQNLGVMCFTSKPDCLIMWAHYGNNHQGILVEYNTKDFSTEPHPFFEGEINNEDSKLHPTLVKIKANPVWYIKNSERISFKAETFEEFQMQHISTFFAKSAQWFYEAEYRMLVDFVLDKNKIAKENNYYLRIPEEVIANIYIGCRATPANKKSIVQDFIDARKCNPKLEHIKIFETVKHPDNFKLGYRKIAI